MTKSRERKTGGYTREELIELRKMKQAFRRGNHLTSTVEQSIRSLGLRHTLQQVEREADLTKKNKSSAEVVLSFLAGLTVGAFKAGHRFMFPSLPDEIEVNSETTHKKRG
ncbi:hypothetical protein KJZ67_02645 [Patescibacteria group bacterium]|nr:hypothetical protein [Patescibacteria group bacterium]